MTKIVAVYSMKGGVGKTTIAVNLAYRAAAQGSQRTLLWEIDAQGAASFLLGHERASAKAKRVFSRDVDAHALIEHTRWAGLDLLGADLSMRHLDTTLYDADKPKRLRRLLQGLAGEYDWIILDCPPGLGEVSDQVFRAVDLIVVPVPPTPMSLRALDLIADHVEQAHGGNPPLLPVLSMVDRRKKLHRETVEARPDWPVIPQASLVERMAVDQMPVGAKAPSSPSARAIDALWAKLEDQLGERPKGHKPAKSAKLPRIPRGTVKAAG